MDKKALPAKPDAPRLKTWSFSFSVTRAEPEGEGETVLSLAKRLTVLDLALAGGLFTLFVLEPLGVYLYLTHHGLVTAESCAAGNPNVVVHAARPGPEPFEAGHVAAPGQAAGASGDVITPLDVRDPSALVMGPGAYQYQPQAARAPEPARAPDADWKEALEAASAAKPLKADLPAAMTIEKGKPR